MQKENTPPDLIRSEIFAPFNVPTEIDDRYKELVVDKTTGLIANEWSPAWSLESKKFIDHRAIIPEYTYWQAGIDEWISKTEGMEKMPAKIDNIHTADTFSKSPTIVIIAPSNTNQLPGGRTYVEVELEAPNGFDKVEFYLNDQLQFTEVRAPYQGQIRIPNNAPSGKTYTITAYVYDKLGYRNSSSIQVKVEN